ncbi:MAG: heme lyase CcmF/NrfE family subunit, partial [Nocardioidaceae bacterium]|nr:heme lyase CcmF/NrfE family subunit [Nocardioidaceae bacterium]
MGAATVGTAGLGVALALAVLGCALAVVGGRRGAAGPVRAAGRLAVAVLVLGVVVDLAMLAALLGDDFSSRYV